MLYNNALRDYNAGKYDLSSQEFGDYLKYYEHHRSAGNAQFYLADIEYRQGNFDAAVKDYDKVLEQYPGGSKAAAAQLKKGYALLELGQREAGVRELNSLIARYPRSIEASQARDRLKRLGVPDSATPPHRDQDERSRRASVAPCLRQSPARHLFRRRAARHALRQDQLTRLATDIGQVHAERNRTRDARHSADGHRPRRADAMGDGSRKERPNGAMPMNIIE